MQIAATWPNTTVAGFDLHQPSVVAARAAAVEAAVDDRVTFAASDAADIGPGPFEVVTFFDLLHDMGDPPAALRRAHEVLDDGGVLVVVEPWPTDRLEDGIGNLSVRIDYSCSIAVHAPFAGSAGRVCARHPGRAGSAAAADRRGRVPQPDARRGHGREPRPRRLEVRGGIGR